MPVRGVAILVVEAAALVTGIKVLAVIKVPMVVLVVAVLEVAIVILIAV